MKKKKKVPPPKVKAPLARAINYHGCVGFCNNCGSTVHKSGFLGLFGERLCDQPECPNSKSRLRK
jgi:hypothetical protein